MDLYEYEGGDPSYDAHRLIVMHGTVYRVVMTQFVGRDAATGDALECVSASYQAADGSWVNRWPHRPSRIPFLRKQELGRRFAATLPAAVAALLADTAGAVFVRWGYTHETGFWVGIPA